MAAGGNVELSENEKKLLEFAALGKTDEVTRLLAEKDVRVDCMDKSGMTPLQHACYKGQRETCELLLRSGADVNANQHEHGYTALMFAAITGKTDIVSLLLDHGARPTAQNNVGRTAGQMAAFVSQHQCVSMINNFFSRDQLDYYTVPHGLETEPKLPPFLAPSLHKYIIINNLNPVCLSLYLRDHQELLRHPEPVCRVLDIILEKAFKEASDTSDFFSIKVHYFLCVFKECEKCFRNKNGEIDTWIKNLLRGRDGDGFREFQEKFLRDVVKRYPYPASTILQHIVRQVAPVAIGDRPTALQVLDSSVNGPHFAEDDAKMCHTCGNKVTKAKCSACKVAWYCDQACQKLHWFTHKKFCKQMAEELRIRQEHQRLAVEREERRVAEQERLNKERQDKITEEGGVVAGTLEPYDSDNDVNELCADLDTNDIGDSHKADVGGIPDKCPFKHAVESGQFDAPEPPSGFGDSET